MSFSVYAPRPILVDSSYRDRTKYPYAADFVIPFGNQSVSNGVNDPILAAYIVESKAFGVISASLPALYPTAAYGSPFEEYYYPQVVIDLATDVPNLHVGQYLYIPSRGSQKIVALFFDQPVAGQSTVFVESPYQSLPVAGDNYYIRQFESQPVFNGPSPLPGLTAVGANPNVDFTLPVGASPQDNAYKSMYMIPLSGANTGFVRVITSYDGSTRQGKVSPFPYPLAPGIQFEILRVYRDNATSWQYGGSIATEAGFTNYKIQLCYLILPNQDVFSGWGGNIQDYPYVMVKFQPVQGGTSNNTIQTNNPFSSGATVMSQIQSTSSEHKFIAQRGCCCDGAIVKLSPASDIRVTVTLPNGDLLKFDPAKEKYAYEPANPDIQISMFLQIQKIV